MEAFSRRNRLVYPSGVVAGFDPTHPAAVGMGPGRGASFVVRCGLLSNLLYPFQPAGGFTNGTNSPGVHGVIGPTINWATNANNGFEYAGYSTDVDTGATFGAIMVFNNVAIFATMLTATGSSSGALFIQNNTSIQISSGGGTGTSPAASSIAIPVSTPVFVGGTVLWSTRCWYVIKNLITGQLLWQTVTSAISAAGASNGHFCVPTTVGLGSSPIGGMAAGMFSPQAISPGALLQWADDPWSFWYPQYDESWVGVAAAPATPATETLMPMISM